MELPPAIRYSAVLSRGWSSRIIARVGDNMYSHIDAILPPGILVRSNGNMVDVGGRFFGARFDAVGGRYSGVWDRPSNYEMRPYNRTDEWIRQDIYELPCTEEMATAWFNFLWAQRGKPYNWPGIAAFAWGRNWREDDSWFSSELAIAALEKCGACPDLYVPSSKITPNDAALILTARGARITRVLIPAGTTL